MQSVQASAQAQHDQVLRQAIADFSLKFWSVLDHAAISKNPITFHKCCFTFTGRKRVLTAGHPEDESVPAKKFLADHSVASHEDLAAVLLELSQARTDHLQNTVPTRNKDHQNPQALRKRQPLPVLAPPQLPTTDHLSRIATLERELEEARTARDRFYEMFRYERHHRVAFEAEVFGQQHTAMALDSYIKYKGWKVNTDRIFEAGCAKGRKKARELMDCVEFDLYPALPLPRPVATDPNPPIFRPSRLQVEPSFPPQTLPPPPRDGRPN